LDARKLSNIENTHGRTAISTPVLVAYLSLINTQLRGDFPSGASAGCKVIAGVSFIVIPRRYRRYCNPIL